MRKPLRLIYEEINETEPDDVAYVYSGYAPLSIRLVQCVIQKQVMAQAARGGGTGAGAGGYGLGAATGWKGFEDVIRNVGGKTIDETQTGEDKAVRAKGKKKTSLACFFTKKTQLFFPQKGFLSHEQ